MLKSFRRLCTSPQAKYDDPSGRVLLSVEVTVGDVETPSPAVDEQSSGPPVQLGPTDHLADQFQRRRVDGYPAMEDVRRVDIVVLVDGQVAGTVLGVLGVGPAAGLEQRAVGIHQTDATRRVAHEHLSSSVQFSLFGDKEPKAVHLQVASVYNSYHGLSRRRQRISSSMRFSMSI